MIFFAEAGQRRRLFRTLDVLTIKWATGDLLEECRFLLNTQLMFFNREKDPTSKQFDDDDEWIRSLTEAQENTTDVPEDSVMCDQQHIDPQKVRSTQMEEFLQKFVEIAALATSMRQIGPKVAPRPWPSSISSSTTSGPQVNARIKVDDTNCFGATEWKAVREAASQLLPKHAAPATWKHRNLSHVEQEGLAPMPKDCGAEQGDVDGPLEPSSGNGGGWGTGTRGSSGGVRQPSMDWC